MPVANKETFTNGAAELALYEDGRIFIGYDHSGFFIDAVGVEQLSDMLVAFLQDRVYGQQPEEQDG